jgi:tripeptide aminopeptidase
MEYAPLINRKRLLGYFTDLLRINSPSFDERKIGDYLAGRLEKAGCSVRFQDYKKSFNIIAFLRGDRKYQPLMLTAHMDTIEPTTGISFAVDSDRVRSTGNTVLGADDKSALAQILEVVTVLKGKSVPHGDMEIVFSSAEEKGLIGAVNLDFKKLKSRHALVLDSSGAVGSIVVGAPTHLRYKMTITGKSAHAGLEPEKGISSIRVAAGIISAVPDGRIDAETSANIGMIEGGTATNVVPRTTVIHGEIRSHKHSTLEKTKKAIFDNARRMARKCNAQLDIEDGTEYSAFSIPRNAPFLKYIRGVYRDLGIEPCFVKTGGGSDANIFNRHGIMALNISNGMQKIHSPEEYIMLDDLYKGCEIALRAVSGFRLEAQN